MKNRTLIILAGILGVISTLAAPLARADDQRFSLSSAFDNGSDEYSSGPWAFKLTAPSSLGVPVAPDQIGGIKDPVIAHNPQSGFNETEAAASYNLYAGSASSPEVNLTGKVRLNLGDKGSTFGLKQNDYLAQMDVYQNLDRFTAKGTLGSKLQGGPTGIILSPVLYGSFGGVYQFTDQTSTGVDMRLSQDVTTPGAMQQEVSAYVNYKLDKNLKARGYVQRGYSYGNPSNILGGQVYYGF